MYVRMYRIVIYFIMHAGLDHVLYNLSSQMMINEDDLLNGNRLID